MSTIPVGFVDKFQADYIMLSQQTMARLWNLVRHDPEAERCCEVLGRSCASTAMIFAMHQIEVACLVRHAHSSAFFRDYLAGLARHQWLIASATSEIGTAGDLRSSVCAVERDGLRIHVTKRAPIISYGEEADDILLTARRAPQAAPADQVLVLARRDEVRLTRTSGWDTLTWSSAWAGTATDSRRAASGMFQPTRATGTGFERDTASGNACSAKPPAVIARR